MKAEKFEDLEVWKKAHKLANDFLYAIYYLLSTCLKVVDIFGNDTNKLLNLEV